jgi:hypothetical protein
MAGFLGGGFDPSQYTEHQAYLTGISSSSWVTLMSVSGKGFLEQALLNMYQPNTTSVSWSTEPELLITVDGTVVLDLVFNGQAAVEQGYAWGVASTSSFVPTVGTSSVYPVGYIPGTYYGSNARAFDANSQYANLTFPSSAQQSAAGQSINSVYCAPVFFLDNPIYFQQSLLIQIKGVPAASTYNICGNAKARY